MRSEWRWPWRVLRRTGGTDSSHGARVLSQVGLLALFLTVLLLSGCVSPKEFPQTAMDPTTEYGLKQQRLWEQILLPAGIVFVVVEGLIVFTIIRYRARPVQPRPKQIHGHTTFEIAWTIAPAVVLAYIAVPTVQTVFDVGGPAPAGAMKVEVIGHQWWWEFRYPDQNIVTANELVVPVGKYVDLQMTSADVIHSFWLPRIGGKRDVVPNHTNYIWFDAPTEPGMYLGQCAEFCGTSHANMRVRGFVQPDSDFQAWVRNQQAPAVQPTAPLAATGAQVFQRSACIGCHTIAGTNARGVTGPNLTHVGSRTTIAAGLYENNPTEMARWLRDPPAMKPGSLMPNLNLSGEDIAALVAYLEALK